MMNVFHEIAILQENHPGEPKSSYKLEASNQVILVDEKYTYGLPEVNIFRIPDISYTKPVESSQKYDQAKNKHPTSFWGTIFHIIFLSCGSPVLLLPSTFVVVGFVTGSVTMLFIFLFYLYTTHMLIWSSNQICKLKKVPSVSYSNLVFEAFDMGPPSVKPLAKSAQLLLSWILICGWYGTCILLGLLMVENLQTLCASWITPLTAQKIVIIISVPVLLLNLIRRLKFLEPFSILGFLLNMAAIFLVLYYAITDSVPWSWRTSNGSIEKVPQLMGVILGNINNTGIVMSLKNEMKHPEKFEAPYGALSLAYGIVFIIYFSMCIFFFLKYGANVPPNIINLLPSNDILSLLTTIMNVTGLYLLFPITLYVPLYVLWNDVLRERTKFLRFKFAWQYAVRILLILLILFLVYINLNVSFVLSFFGTVTSSLDSLAFPIITHSLVVWKVCDHDSKTTLILMKNVVMLIIGLVLTVAGILDCIADLA